MATQSAEETKKSSKAGAAANGTAPTEPAKGSIEELLQSQAASEVGLERFEKVRTEVDAFWCPELEIDMGGGLTKKVLANLRCIPLQRKERPASATAAGGTYYLCLVTAPMLARNDKKEIVRLEVGSTVWVDQRYDFRNLAVLIPAERHNPVTGAIEMSGGELFVKPLEKINLKGGGRTKWRFDIRASKLDANQLASFGLGKAGSYNKMLALPAAPEAVDDPADRADNEIPF